jgi:hypothetical protein
MRRRPVWRLLRVHATGSASRISRKARQQLLEQHADLQACESRSQAVVDAVPEAEVGVRVARDVEAHRLREDARVAAAGGGML